MSKLVEETVVEHTPEEELESLKNKELWFHEELKKPDSYISELYSTSSPKKDNISSLAENLERQHELELLLKREPTLESVGQISSYIKSKLRDSGVHQSTLSYVHMVLGYKYKNDKYDTSEKEDSEGDNDYRHNSSKQIVNFEQENQSLIDTIDQQQAFLKNLKNKAKSSHMISVLDNKQLLQYEETNLRTRATIILADQFIDDRQSVPLFAQLKLVMAVVASTNNFAAGMYVSQIKLFGANRMVEAQKFFEKASIPVLDTLPEKSKKLFADTLKNMAVLRKGINKLEKKQAKKTYSKSPDLMTSKQAMKIVFGVVKKVLAVFDHRDRDEALLDGFYGIQCQECGSFRVKQKEAESNEWLCFCFKCECTFEARTVTKCWNCHLPLFEQILQVIQKTASVIEGKDGADTGAREGSCPRCENKLILPAKMFLKPKLRAL